MTSTVLCAGCGLPFEPSQRQLKRHRSEAGQHRKMSCSPSCTATIAASSRARGRPLYGPCPTCGAMFESRYAKTYCTMRCYTASPAFKERQRAGSRAALLAKGCDLEPTQWACLQCGVERHDISKNEARKRKFCSKSCRRTYFAERFDRWVASPQTLALPQAYDEFLDAEELPCLVDGCGWHGQLLSYHMNVAHGVPKDEFKEMAGFNKGTGVIGSAVRKKLESRDFSYLADVPEWGAYQDGRSLPHDFRCTASLEGREHRHKSVALRVLEAPTLAPRICQGCGAEFTPDNNLAHGALYCTETCRTKFYYNSKGASSSGTCASCGASFETSSRPQRASIAAGRPVVCSPSCRAKLNSQKRRRG